MSLEQQISKGIMEAMKAKEPVRLQTLRNIKKYIIEAKTAGTEIVELPDADVVKIIAKLAKQGSDSAEIYRQQNRADHQSHSHTNDGPSALHQLPQDLLIPCGKFLQQLIDGQVFFFLRFKYCVEQRYQHHSCDQGCQHGKYNGESQLLKHLSGQALHSGQRQIYHDGGNGGSDNRSHHFLRSL